MPSLEQLCAAPDACCSKTNNTRRVKTKTKAKTKRIPSATQRCAATQVQPRIVYVSRTSLVSCCPPLLSCLPRGAPARDGPVHTTMHVPTPTTDESPPQESWGSSFPSPCCPICFPDGNDSANAESRMLPPVREPMLAPEREPILAPEREPMLTPEREYSGDTYCHFVSDLCSGESETDEWLPPPPPPPSSSPHTPVDWNDGFESRRAHSSKPTTRFCEPGERRTKAKGVRMLGDDAAALREGSVAADATTAGRKRVRIQSSKRQRRPVKTPKRRVDEIDIDGEDAYGRRERTACGVAVKAPILPFIGRCRMVTADGDLPTEPSELSDQSSINVTDDSRRRHHARRPECGVCHREPCSCCSIS